MTALTSAERTCLLRLAREAIGEFLGSGGSPVVDESQITARLREPHACFVTLTSQGDLRGCIGNLEPREPLFRSVIHNACGAAFRDSRFEPVAVYEISRLEVEISVLSPANPLNHRSPEDLLRQLRPNEDGVVLRLAGKSATFLPQVWGKIPDAARFMDELARKARLPDSAWRSPDAVVLTYQVESFADVRCAG